VHLSWENVGEVVKHEGGLVREDARFVRPEPEGGQVFMLASREVNDAVDAASNARDPEVVGGITGSRTPVAMRAQPPLGAWS
jgi:hypothetical protein